MSLTATVVVAVVVLAVYVTWTAGRLDRLHARVDAAWAALDAQLVRRAAAARALVGLLPPGPAAVALDRAATAALAGGPDGREGLEDDLTRALRDALAPLPTHRLPPALRDELVTATTRVGLARSFHDGAVADARRVRVRRMVRALHLAGHRTMPLHFDLERAVERDVGRHVVADTDVDAGGDIDGDAGVGVGSDGCARR